MKALIRDLTRRLKLQVGRCVISAINDSGDLQRLQIKLLAGEVMDNVARLGMYGVTSHPHPGAEGVFIAVGGNRTSGIVIATEDRRYRLEVAEGEVALYDDQGQVVHVKRNGLELKGNNVLIQTEGVFRIDADGIEMHAVTYRQDDIAGYGQRRTHNGGAEYHDDTYTTGATFDEATEHGIDPPDIPSDHPEASE